MARVLKAEETGDYDFVLKTPTAAAAMGNDDVEPLIDAWVASRQISEHKGTTRLIGGRAYSIKLNYFKSKEKTAAIRYTGNRRAVRTADSRAQPFSRGSDPDRGNHDGFPAGRQQLVTSAACRLQGWDEATTSAAIEVANTSP